MRYLLWIQPTNDRVRVECKSDLTVLVRSFRIKGTDQKRMVMSKEHYFAEIANFCPIENPSEEEVTQYIKKLGGIDVTISEQDVVLWASDIRWEVP